MKNLLVNLLNSVNMKQNRKHSNSIRKLLLITSSTRSLKAKSKNFPSSLQSTKSINPPQTPIKLCRVLPNTALFPKNGAAM